MPPVTTTLPTALVNARGVRLRSEPLIDNNVIGTLGSTSVVTLLQTSGSWTLVNTGEPPFVRGWVFSKYLKPISAREEFPWMPIALAELGQAEIPGAEHNARILTYHAAAELDQAYAEKDETPWCSSFACFCVEAGGYASTNSAAARSWLSWGKPCPVPRRGVIAVFDRPGFPGSAHVAFYLHDTAAFVHVLGGNQGNAVSRANYARSRLLGYRVPDPS